MSRFYDRFIGSTQKDPDTNSREVVLNVILFGLVLFTAVIALDSFISLVVHNRPEHFWRFVWINILLAFFGGLYWFTRKQHRTKTARWVIVLLFFCAGIFVTYRWGIQNPIGNSLFCLTVVMASVLIGSWYALLCVAAAGLFFVVMVYVVDIGVLKPDVSWVKTSMTLGDVTSFISLFAIIGLISWLFNRQMEISLRRARKSEKALIRQRDLLEEKVEQRTRALQEAQIQKIQEFYRFAELGHLSTAFFHDLSNYSSSLSLDIEGLGNSSQGDMVRRIKKNIRYINDVVRRVNTHLQSGPERQKIDVNQNIRDIVSIVEYNANKFNVTISLDLQDEKAFVSGDLTKFRQLVMNLIANAVEAFDGTRISAKSRRVLVTTKVTKLQVAIKVRDFGKGIPRAKQKKIFEPFYSSKTNGTGIGLFIVKQVAETDFSGNITLVSNKRDGTLFIATLPRA